MNTTLTGVLTPGLRQKAYLIIGLLGLALTATQAGFTAGSGEQPTWLLVAWAVYGVLSAAFTGGVAASNVQPEQEIVSVQYGTTLAEREAGEDNNLIVRNDPEL